jgi:excisionase family DNA binding protein
MRTENDESRKPFTASGLAREAGVHHSYVTHLVREGVIPAMKIGNAWIIQREDGLAWIAEREERLQEDESE